MTVNYIFFGTGSLGGVPSRHAASIAVLVKVVKPATQCSGATADVVDQRPICFEVYVGVRPGQLAEMVNVVRQVLELEDKAVRAGHGVVHGRSPLFMCVL